MPMLKKRSNDCSDVDQTSAWPLASVLKMTFSLLSSNRLKRFAVREPCSVRDWMERTTLAGSCNHAQLTITIAKTMKLEAKHLVQSSDRYCKCQKELDTITPQNTLTRSTVVKRL